MTHSGGATLTIPRHSGSAPVCLMDRLCAWSLEFMRYKRVWGKRNNCDDCREVGSQHVSRLLSSTLAWRKALCVASPRKPMSAGNLLLLSVETQRRHSSKERSQKPRTRV